MRNRRQDSRWSRRSCCYPSLLSVPKVLRRNGSWGKIALVVAVALWLTGLAAYKIYRTEEEHKRNQILTVLGTNRSTALKVLPYEDTTIIKPLHGCQFAGKNALGIIIVPTVAGNRDRRELIRTTWGSNRFDAQMMLFFFSGKPKGDLNDLEREASTHGDLIVDDMEDHYYALGIKTLRMLKWFQLNCPRAQFLIKADDDVFLNLPLLSQTLRNASQGFRVGGRLLLGRTPNVWNPFLKWFTPAELWPSDWTPPPPYLGGPSYIIKGDVVPAILNTSLTIPLYHLEDVFVTGVIAHLKLGFELTNMEGILDPKYPCWWYWSHKYLSPHKFLLSFHTDGALHLTSSLYRDFESA